MAATTIRGLCRTAIKTIVQADANFIALLAGGETPSNHVTIARPVFGTTHESDVRTKGAYCWIGFGGKQGSTVREADGSFTVPCVIEYYVDPRATWSDYTALDAAVESLEEAFRAPANWAAAGYAVPPTSIQFDDPAPHPEDEFAGIWLIPFKLTFQSMG